MGLLFDKMVQSFCEGTAVDLLFLLLLLPLRKRLNIVRVTLRLAVHY
jgi:hypothetical protein